MCPVECSEWQECRSVRQAEQLAHAHSRQHLCRDYGRGYQEYQGALLDHLPVELQGNELCYEQYRQQRVSESAYVIRPLYVVRAEFSENL